MSGRSNNQIGDRGESAVATALLRPLGPTNDLLFDPRFRAGDSR